MMHRVYGHWDVVLAQGECHPPAFGGSTTSILGWGVCNAGGLLGFWKTNSNITVGLLRDMPMGQGHDGGPGRVHILVVPAPEPATSATLSSSASILCTAMSSAKPHFTAHTVQFNVGQSSLPICCQMLPYLPTDLSILMCSMPDIMNITPVVPTQLSLWVGMTWGDFFGGLVNVFADQLWSIATFGLGKKIDSAGKYGELASNLLSGAMKAGGGVNLGTGPSNLGGMLQRGIDGDGVTSDAASSITVFGFGVTVPGDSSTPAIATPAPSAPWSL